MLGSRLSCILGNDLGVVFKLVHPHILDTGTNRRDSLGSNKYKHIALKEVFRFYHIDLRQRVICPRVRDLVFLKFPACGHFIGNITDADRTDAVAAQKMKPGQQRTSDVADRQHMDSFLRFLRFFCQNSLKIRMQAVDCAHHALNDRSFDCLVKFAIHLFCRATLRCTAACRFFRRFFQLFLHRLRLRFQLPAA